MRVAEVYRSLQGEGFLTGTQSAFVRVSGCNLRCHFCDTPYASWQPEGEDFSVEELLARVEALAVDHVVLTGGEPMLFAELIPLCAQLRRQGRHITIETAGTLYLPVDCDLMSISPKLSNSTPSPDRDARWAVRHQRSRHVPEVIRRLTTQYEYQLKFVVNCAGDCEEIHRYLEEFSHLDRGRIMLMPQGIDAAELARQAEWLIPYCRQHHFHYCPRRQIEWFGHRRGT